MARDSRKKKKKKKKKKEKKKKEEEKEEEARAHPTPPTGFSVAPRRMTSWSPSSLTIFKVARSSFHRPHDIPLLPFHSGL